MEVTVYTKANCKWCKVAKAALNTHAISYVEIDIEGSEYAMKEFEMRTNGAKTVPQITIGDTLVGGASDLLEKLETGEISKIMEAN